MKHTKQAIRNVFSAEPNTVLIATVTSDSVQLVNGSKGSIFYLVGYILVVYRYGVWWSI